MDRERLGAWAGILSGIGLAGEAAFFMLSGWSAEAFSSFDGAIGILREGGHFLRLAVVFGIFNLALLALFFAGLAERFDRKAPALGGAVLYLGLVGVAAHSIVPIGFYSGVPLFQDLAARPDAAVLWQGFKMLLDVAQGAGLFFMGLSMIAAGIGAWTHRLLPAALGVVAILAGAMSVLTPLAFGTFLMPAAGLFAMGGILLSILFRFWGGLALLRPAEP